MTVANNFYHDDSLFTQTVVLCVRNGLHPAPALKDSVKARMRILLSSRIYDLWQKWYCIRFADGGLRHAEMKLPLENKVTDFYFDNSGTSGIFHAQSIAWLVATGILVDGISHRAVAQQLTV